MSSCTSYILLLQNSGPILPLSKSIPDNWNPKCFLCPLNSYIILACAIHLLIMHCAALRHHFFFSCSLVLIVNSLRVIWSLLAYVLASCPFVTSLGTDATAFYSLQQLPKDPSTEWGCFWDCRVFLLVFILSFPRSWDTILSVSPFIHSLISPFKGASFMLVLEWYFLGVGPDPPAFLTLHSHPESSQLSSFFPLLLACL